MAFAKPTISLGLRIKNCAFACPSDVDGVPAYWDINALDGSAKHSDGPNCGHPRWQRWSKSSGSYGSALSHPTPVGQLCGTGNIPLVFYTLIKSSGLGSGNTITIELLRYNISGVNVESHTLLTLSGNDAIWNARGTTLLKAFSAGSVYYNRFRINVTRVSGTPTIDLAFIGLGVWSVSYGDGAYTFPNYIARAGSTPCLPNDADQPYQTQGGEERWNDAGRIVSPRSGVLFFDWESGEHGLSPLSFGDAMRYARMMNKQRSMEGSTTIPEGGRWPLIVCPGTPGWPNILQCRFADPRLPLEYAGDFLTDPADHSLALNLVEVI
jgi:hypothetical protein